MKVQIEFLMLISKAGNTLPVVLRYVKTGSFCHWWYISVENEMAKKVAIANITNHNNFSKSDAVSSKI